MMLEWLGERHDAPVLVQAGQAISDAVDRVFAQRLVKPADIGGSDGTGAITRAVIAALK
jgi:3-isopropylmalate dehydrogenase